MLGAKRFTLFVFAAIVFSCPVFAAVTVSSPANGASVAGPVHVIASASGAHPVVSMRVYADNTSVYLVYSSKLDTYLNLAVGAHSLIVQAWESTGTVLKTSLTVNVLAQNTKVFSNIDQLTGWGSCDVCAGANANGPTAPHWQAQFQTTPSLDGSSSEFFLGGATPYSSALWWKQLGPNNTAAHFIYDLYFYFTDANAPEALEFDVNQSFGGRKYIFGTECGFKNTPNWRVWDVNLHWVNTGIVCTAKTANVWHHLTWEFERVNGKVHYIAVKVDGVRTVVNRYQTPDVSGVQELNTAFQMDGNSTMTDFKVWLDKVKLTIW